MSLVRINRHPAPKDLRLFAALWLLFGGAFALAVSRHGHGVASIGLASLAAVVGLTGLVRPRWVRVVYLAAVYVTFPIGFVLSHVILAGVYFGVFTPIGLLMRLLGKDPLQRRFVRAQSTYWEAKDAPRSPASYLKQH